MTRRRSPSQAERELVRVAEWDGDSERATRRERLGESDNGTVGGRGRERERERELGWGREKGRGRGRGKGGGDGGSERESVASERAKSASQGSE